MNYKHLYAVQIYILYVQCNLLATLQPSTICHETGAVPHQKYCNFCTSINTTVIYRKVLCIVVPSLISRLHTSFSLL